MYLMSNFPLSLNFLEEFFFKLMVLYYISSVSIFLRLNANPSSEVRYFNHSKVNGDARKTNGI